MFVVFTFFLFLYAEQLKISCLLSRKTANLFRTLMKWFKRLLVKILETVFTEIFILDFINNLQNGFS